MKSFSRSQRYGYLIGAATLVLVSLLPAWTVAEADHEHMQHSNSASLGSEFQILRLLDAPSEAPGHLAYDPESNRLWMVTMGPPANTSGPSRLYEIDPVDGRVRATAQLPFLGEFGMPSFLDGRLFLIVHHESTMYEISVAADTFGEIVKETALPTVNEVGHDGEEPLRFPFIAFKGLTHAGDGSLIAHAQDLGEFFRLDPKTGQAGERVRTLRSLAGISATSGPNGELLVIATSDPIKAAFEYHVRRYMFRASHGIVPAVRYGKKAIHWVLLDGRSGETLASIRRLEPRIEASSVALVGRKDVEGARYGRFEFWATGSEGLFLAQWTPGLKS